MKLKLIKDNEVVVNVFEYNDLKYMYDAFVNVIKSTKNQTAVYQVFDYEDMCDVVINCGKGFITIKRFNSDDQDYNRICAEELVELLNQEQ